MDLMKKKLERSKFSYLWRANFMERSITQDPDDLYSRHKPGAEWNPSSFRDFQNYFDNHPKELVSFELVGKDKTYVVSFNRPWAPIIYCDATGKWNGDHIVLHREKRPLKDVRIIYYRKMEATMEDGVLGEPRVLGYVLGYQGLDENGNSRKKTITVI